MKIGYVLRHLASAVSAEHSQSARHGYRWLKWQETGLLEVSVVIRVKLLLTQGWALHREGEKNAVRHAREFRSCNASSEGWGK